jgi:hypothetical protein
MTHVPCLGIRDLANAAVDGFYFDTAGHDRPPPPPAEWNVPDQVINDSQYVSLMDSIRAKHKVAPVSCKVTLFCRSRFDFDTQLNSKLVLTDLR